MVAFSRYDDADGGEDRQSRSPETQGDGHKGVPAHSIEAAQAWKSGALYSEASACVESLCLALCPPGWRFDVRFGAFEVGDEVFMFCVAVSSPDFETLEICGHTRGSAFSLLLCRLLDYHAQRA